MGALPTPDVSCNKSGNQYGGAVFYEDRPYSRYGFSNSRWLPVRYAKVTVYDGSTPPVALGNAITDSHGIYCVASNQAAAEVRVQVQTVATPPDVGGLGTVTVTYLRETGAEPYRVNGALVAAGGGGFTRLPSLGVHVDDQVPLSVGINVRVGGAFNILDVVTSGYQTIQSAWGTSSGVKLLADMVVEWRADLTSGTHYHPGLRRMHISGESGGDSDEFDDDTILHEFGHFVVDQLGLDSSHGGQHYINGYTQDARLAWSEGWASFVSAMIRDLNPAAASSLEGPQWMINAFTLTQGDQKALQWAYEIDTPEALIGDPRKPDNEPALVSSAFFRARVKTGTSEASVSAALWDIYNGVPSAPGIGKDGMYNMLAASRDLPPGTIMTFGRFWQTLEPTLTSQQRVALRAQMVQDRVMSLDDDVFGADDTLTELNATVSGTGDATHRFGPVSGMSASYPIGEQFTLYPEGDVDLYWLDVPGPATTMGSHYVITTFDLSDGADTVLELLDGTGVTDASLAPVLVSNDNYQDLIINYCLPTEKGCIPQPTVMVRDYAGQCAPIPTGVSICPPNVANYPGQSDNLRKDGSGNYMKEYLASQLDVWLQAGSYLIRVTRSANAPPSAGPHGAYRLKVDHQMY
ncbi:MAG: hypothetical protein OEW11_08465 [Nitrospirota bacterium]|nr:hypothetical protein [Nitrospirota bacterium]